MTQTLYQNDDGIKRQLDFYTGAGGAADLNGGKCRLCTAPTSFTHSKVFGDFAEATFNGYAAVTLSSANWPAASVSAHVASAVYAVTITFTCTGGGSPETVYGFYITDSGNTKLLYCSGLDGGPYTIQNNGDKVEITLTVQQQSIN